MFHLHLGTRTYNHDIFPLWNQYSRFSAQAAMDPRTTTSSLNSEYDLRVVSVGISFAKPGSESDHHFAVACLTILVGLLGYMSGINCSWQYHHIWKSKWGLIKCLYLWSRYGTFIDTILAAIRRLDMNVNLDPSICNTLSKFDAIFSGLGIGIAEIILMTRTYALYGRSKKLLGFFIIMWLSIGGVSGWAAINWTNSFKRA
ncbi:hypothetical protein B0H13DRAFT_2070658 [Mycena leptocephala]|nr:hypothetical protein B0H13DRAFT_2070658 [Mycena leptocephala]